MYPSYIVVKFHNVTPGHNDIYKVTTATPDHEEATAKRAGGELVEICGTLDAAMRSRDALQIANPEQVNPTNVYACLINVHTLVLESVTRRKDLESVERAAVTCIGFSLKKHHDKVLAWADNLQGDDQEIIVAADTLSEAALQAVLFYMVFR